jgi:hypothetical protein
MRLALTSKLSAVLLAVLAIAVSACGYTLAGRGSFLPASIRTIGVPAFTNTTSVYQLDSVVTDKVRSELIGRGRYKVLPQETDVDAVLKGEISSVTLTPTAFNDQQQATRYQIVVVAKVEFIDVAGKKTLWQNPGLVVRDEFQVASLTTATPDASTFFGNETNALERVASDFARAVISAILEAF